MPAGWPQQLEEVGYETEYVEAGAPGRGNVFARLPGADPTRGALLVHGHLDVVPAEAVGLERAPVLRRASRTATCGAAARST